jgi:hypothetical protein
MEKREVKKGRIKREDWPEDLYWNDGTYKERDGQARLDMARQGYPGQPLPPDGTPDEISSGQQLLGPDSEPWFSRESSWHGRDAER